jgi:hypothetical protein
MRRQRYHLMLSLAIVVLMCCTACPVGQNKPVELQSETRDGIREAFQKHCEMYCQHLRGLHCIGGTPLRDGTTCETFCFDTNLGGHPIPRDQKGKLVTSERFLNEQSCETLQDVIP